MHDYNSLASWVLYFIERALFIQYQSNIKGEYTKCKDHNRQSVFVQANGKNIVLFDELKPFWRTFCESMKQNGDEQGSFKELADEIKQKAFEEFEIKEPKKLEDSK